MELKVAKVIPVFKKGNKKIIENYRPISILSSLSKLFEKIVYSQMIQYLQFDDLLSPHQFGFVSNNNTEAAFLSLITTIITLIDT